MSKTIQLTDEQWEALQRGEAITIEPPKPRRWKPMTGPFVIGAGSEVLYYTTDQHLGREFGMRYPTRGLAERAANFMRAHRRLVAYALEHWPEYEVPNAEGSAYFPSYDITRCEWFATAYGLNRNPWIPYGPREKVEELVERLNSGEVVL